MMSDNKYLGDVTLVVRYCKSGYYAVCRDDELDGYPGYTAVTHPVRVTFTELPGASKAINDAKVAAIDESIAEVVAKLDYLKDEKQKLLALPNGVDHE